MIYPDRANSAKVAVTIDLRVGGKLLQSETLEDLPAPDETGAIPMSICTAAPVGACELEITATQGEERILRTLKYAVVGR